MYSYIFTNSRALWRDHIASAVWSVSREAKDFMSYMTRARTVNFVVFHTLCVSATFCRRIIFTTRVGVYVLLLVFGLCFCSVITDVLWLKLSRTDVLGTGVNRNTLKYRQQEARLLTEPPQSFQKKDCFLSPWWFLIRYQFLSLEWPLAVLQSSHSDLEYLFILFKKQL